jgi:hypothetical protein
MILVLSFMVNCLTPAYEPFAGTRVFCIYGFSPDLGGNTDSET